MANPRLKSSAKSKVAPTGLTMPIQPMEARSVEAPPETSGDRGSGEPKLPH